jgi:hypothetical protein
MRQGLGLSCHDGGKALLQRTSNDAVKLLAPIANETCIGGILHERMLELIGSFGQDTTLVDQLRLDELRKRISQALLGNRRGGGDQGI